MREIQPTLEKALGEAGYKSTVIERCVRFAKNANIKPLGIWAFAWRWAISLIAGTMLSFIWMSVVIFILSITDPLSGRHYMLAGWWPLFAFWLAVAAVFRHYAS